MSITTEDQLLVAMTKAQRALYTKVSVTTVAGSPFSLFGVGGTPPAGAKQGSLNGATPDYTLQGSLYLRNPASGNTLYFGKVAGINGANAGALMFYDRLWHNSEILCNITTDQTIVQPVLTRSTDGVGVEIWGECWTAWGVTGTVFTVTYTNTVGGTGRVATYTWPAGAPTVGQAFRFVLQAGDLGVTSIQKISLTPSTGAAGNLGLFLAKPIGSFGMKAADAVNFDAFQLAIPPISSSACVCAILAPTAATSGQPILDLTLPEG